MSMQMDAEFKKEQIGTLSVRVCALERGFGGWVIPQRGPSQKVDMPSKEKPPAKLHMFGWASCGKDQTPAFYRGKRCCHTIAECLACIYTYIHTFAHTHTHTHTHTHSPTPSPLTPSSRWIQIRDPN